MSDSPTGQKQNIEKEPELSSSSEEEVIDKKPKIDIDFGG